MKAGVVVTTLFPFEDSVTKATIGDCTPPLEINAWLKAFLSLKASKAAGPSWLTRTSYLSFRLGLAF